MKLDKAILKLKETQDSYLKDELDLAIETVLKSYEELKKENEEYSKQMDLEYVDENFISKDKIKEFIKENSHTDTYNFKTVEVSKLQELLGE